MVNIGRPFTEKELKYINKNADILEEGRLEYLPYTSDNTDELIYFLAGLIRKYFKLNLVNTNAGDPTYLFNTESLTDPLDFGVNTVKDLIIKLSVRLNLEIPVIKDLLSKFGVIK